VANRPDPRLADWFDLVGDLLRQPFLAMPLEDIARLMSQTFDAPVVAWSHNLQRAAHRMWPDLMPVLPIDRWLSEGTMVRHPLLRWFGATADPRAQASHRVPITIAPRRDVDRWLEEMRPWGLAHELAMPLTLTRSDHKAFVVARGDDGFTDIDLDLGRRLQPVLAGLLRQVTTLSKVNGARGAADVELTAKEQAILILLAEGLTATAIGRRLMISPRTVEKHLQHIYDKLSVRDKVSAVRRATQAGILPPAELR
jgi:DNA-binding CsgD family transcriptional regulator